MIQFRSLMAAALLALAAAGCTDHPVRSLVIDQGQIHPQRLNVPANTPFDLTAATIGSRPALLQGPSLGIVGLEAPANWISTISPKASPSPGSLTKVRTRVGPLAPGDYRLTCDCGGRNQTVIVVAE